MIVRAQPLVSLVFLQQRSARSRPTMRSHLSPGVASLTELSISPAEISAPFAVLMEKLREIQIIAGTFESAVEYWHADWRGGIFV